MHEYDWLEGLRGNSFGSKLPTTLGEIYLRNYEVVISKSHTSFEVIVKIRKEENVISRMI